jgi:serine/threonine protein kinase
VYRARGADGAVVALKLIPVEVIMRDRRRWENVAREVTAMQRVSAHPNAVRILGVDYDAFKARKGGKPGGAKFVVIAMEYCAGGELMQYLEFGGAFSDTFFMISISVRRPSK